MIEMEGGSQPLAAWEAAFCYVIAAAGVTAFGIGARAAKERRGDFHLAQSVDERYRISDLQCDTMWTVRDGMRYSRRKGMESSESLAI